MKIAIVVDYLNSFGGGERVLESLLEVYPEATVFTSLYDPLKFPVASPIRRARIKSFFPTYLSLITSPWLKHLTFLMPFFFERIDLSAFDLVISIGTIWAKGVKINPQKQKHIFYCLTPPRFLYGYPSETSKRNVWYYRPFTTILDHWLRIWDFNAAQKPDEILVISQEVKERVKKFYRRDSVVVYPPVSLGIRNRELGIREGKKYFLIVSRLVAYKGVETAVEVCNRLKLPLKIVGTGREASRLKGLAGSTVEFLGFRSDKELSQLYQNCLALIFPTKDEDFGIVPLEANSFGKPVVTVRSGGPLETLVEGKTATFYDGSVEDLVRVLKDFSESKFLSSDCLANAQRFSQERFQGEFKGLVGQVRSN